MGADVDANARQHLVIANWRDLDHPQAGGAEVFAESIARRFALSGMRVTLLAAGVAGKPAVERRDGYDVRRAGGTFTVYAAALRWMLRNRKDIDAVLDCQNGIPFFSPLVLRRRTPLLQVIHHVHQEQFRFFFGPLAAFAGRQLEGRIARWVYRRRPSAVISPSTREQVRNLLAMPGPSYLVPCGTDRRGPIERVGRTDQPSIVCVGRLVPHKRTDLLLRALPALLSRFPTLSLHLVGTGPDESRLRAVAAELRLPDTALIWHGWLEPDKRDQLVRSAWLTVNPTRGEGWGLGVIEAAALGVPAVAFRVPGLRDSVRDGITGWLVDEDDSLVPAITDALTQLTDPVAAARRRNACEEWAGVFTWERSAELLAAILQSERGRLGRRGRDRRTHEDAAAVVTVNGPVDLTRMRSTDAVSHVGNDLRILLYGTDPAGASRAVARAGATGSATAVGDDATLLIAAAGNDTKRHETAAADETP